MRVLLLGATGVLGRRAAAELLRQPDVEELWLSGRNGAEVSALADAFGGNSGRVHALPLDLSKNPSLNPGSEPVDVVVSCAGPDYETELAGATVAVDAGSHYVSLCDEYEPAEEVQGLDRRAREAGVTVISGCGVSPGITNLLIAHAVDDADKVESIEISLASSSAETDGEATAKHLLYCLTHKALVVRDGRETVQRAGSSPKLVFFPEPVGWVETFYIGHPEVLTLPPVYPNLSNLEYRLGLAERVTMDAARAFAFMPFSEREPARRLFLTLTRPARPVIDRLPPKGPAWSAVRVDVRIAGTTVSLGVADKMANLTSVPLTLAALRLGRKEALATGVVPVERAFEVNGFLRDLVKRGIGVAELEPAPV
jgi:Saccharopine dehydrogenase NADP binding domain